MNGTPWVLVMYETIQEKTHFEQLQEFISYKVIYIASSYSHYVNFSIILLFLPSLAQLLFYHYFLKSPKTTCKTSGNIGIVPANV